MIPPEVTAYLGKLRKKGQAEVTIYLVADVGDEDFPKNPPTCRVTVVATDSETGRKVFERSKEISVTSPDRSFVVPVQTTLGLIDRYIHSQKPKTLDLAINTEPVDRWSEKYSSTSRTAKIDAGSQETIHVCLRPRVESRGLSHQLDKPKFDPPSR